MSDEQQPAEVPGFQLSDSAWALAEACGMETDHLDDTGPHAMRIDGALHFAQQIRQVMSDIAANFGDDPHNATAMTIFAVAGLVSDMHAIAHHAGVLEDARDIPPHPMRDYGAQGAPRNRAERRAEDRAVRRMGPTSQIPPR